MTHKERFIVLSIFISILGFSLFSVFNPLESNKGKLQPVITSEYTSKIPVLRNGYDNEYNKKIRNKISSPLASSKIAKMLSTVLEIPLDDVIISLEGGIKPSEMLHNSGILLSDLENEFNFKIVGERGFVRFNS